jgi:peptidoglycan/LPS O-acetylase OafA/YrhL
MLLKPYALSAINSPGRIPAIDILRALAAIAVVLFHFNHLLPFGNSGVYLFFVISGFLVGGILVRKYLNRNIRLGQFILERGFKIWPSYFAFVIGGSVFAYYAYSDTHPHAYIPLKESIRYLLFYRNYTGAPDHWNFDHVWTLCIEEHFYILLPASLLILLKSGKPRIKTVLIFATALAISSILSKLLTFIYFPEKPITTPTHNSLDGFAYGIIIYCLRHTKILFAPIVKYACIGTGVALIFSLGLLQSTDFYTPEFQDFLLGILTPVAFAMITFGVIDFKFEQFKFLRIISYYSYNLYLWHLLFYYPITDQFGTGTIGFIVYIVTAFTLAVLFTTLIEEPFIRLRARILPAEKSKPAIGKLPS